MPIEAPAEQVTRRRMGLDGGLLLAAAPFLLFPAVWWPGTLLALLLLLAIWLRPLPGAAAGRLWAPRTPLNLALLLLSVMLGVGILVTADPDLTLPKATGLLLGLTVWRLTAWAGGDRRLRRWLVGGYVLLALGLTAVGAASADWLVKVPALARLLPQRLLLLPEGGAAGIQMNQLAATILLLLPLLLSLWLGGWPAGWRRGRWLWGGLAAGTAVLLLLTQSRSGWIGAAGGLWLLLPLWGLALPAGRRRRQLLGTAVLLLGLAAAGILWFGPQRLAAALRDPAADSIVGDLTTISFRQEVWRWGVLGAADFPYTGAGLGAFRRVIFRLYPANIQADYDIGHAHNMFLQAALDLGVPGLAAYGALLLLVGVIGWRAARRQPAWRPVALGFLASLAALHLFGMTDALALGAKPGVLLWWMWGVLCGMGSGES